MSLLLRQTTKQQGRIDLRGITPDRLADLELPVITQLPITVDNQQVSLSSHFTIEGTPSVELSIIPLNNRVDGIGAGMTRGTLQVTGDAGHHTGSAMQGGKLLVKGSCGDFTGSALQGGELIVQDDVGDATGAPLAGGLRGQNGGVIHIQGNAGDRTGECQRRGLIIVEGDTGALTGYRMIAGTIYIGGCSGEQTGLNMRRGTILLRQRPTQLPITLNYSGALPLTIISLLMHPLLQYLTKQAPPYSASKHMDRYVGDLACKGQGEIIILC